jgi:AcrR family transcriptional regulator
MSLPTSITDAAARLMSRRGPARFSMGALAREAGVSRATLYRLAGSRDEVLAALANRGHAVEAPVAVRERILGACRVVFTRAGFDAATLEEIASEAGVGVATVYRHFKDKESVIVAFAEHLGPRRALREALLRPSGDVRADLERVGAAVIRNASEDLDLIRLALLERLRGGRWAELMKTSPVRSLPMLTRLLKPYVEQGVLGPGDARRMAQAFAGMLFAFFARPALDGGPSPDPEDTARFITQVFLDGLAPGRRS